MNGKRIYLYPITSRGRDDAQNPYIYNLAQNLSERYQIINIDKPSNNGIIQIFQLFFTIDIVYLNWVENLPDRKAGKIQTFLFLGLLFLCKLFGKKIIWTMHNKISHAKTNLKLKKFLFLVLLKYSDLVITHAKEGITYSKALNVHRDIFYFPHPILLPENKIPAVQGEPEYDVLIWGVMTPYKGVSNFLKYLSDRNITDLKILIAGKFASNAYYEEVKAFQNQNTTVINSFIKKENLSAYIRASKIVLFTYENASVLSSGVLADTLVYRSIIVGPHTGSFADLSEAQVVLTYKNFEELIELIQRIHADKKRLLDADIQDQFLQSITWQAYVTAIFKYIN
jgi:beta-1,4-mannosyltransferase